MRTCLGVLGLDVHGGGHMKHCMAAFYGFIKASFFIQICPAEDQVGVCFRQLKQMLHFLRVPCNSTDIVSYIITGDSYTIFLFCLLC